MENFRIGLFGGSFDPIHNGHIHVAEKLLELGILDIIQFTPSYVSYHGKSYNASPKHRIELISEAIKDSKYSKSLMINTFEIHNSMSTCTYDFIDKYLHQERNDIFNHNIEYYFIVGADNAKVIHTFKYSDKLINRIPFIVVNRGDVNINDLDWCNKEPHIIVNIGNKFSDCSSSKIRDIIKNIDDGVPDNFFDDMCSPSVFEYIKKYNLYRS